MSTTSLCALSLMLVPLVGCGASLPGRYVLERDVDAYSYRRYQKTLDIEVVVEGNQGVGHTATYVRRERGKTVAFATAFVTVYKRARALTAEVRERLKELHSYGFSVRELGGGYLWVLDGGEAERWAVWVSGPHSVKIGAPEGEDFPEALVEAYMDTYPSDLDETGRAEPDAPSAGRSRRGQQELDADSPELPEHLREGAAR